MNIVKLGGSIVNPDGKYDLKTINTFISLVEKSSEQFVFVVGGGKICRHIQDAGQPFVEAALPKEDVNEARDFIGIAITKINAMFVLNEFAKKLGEDVHHELIYNPTEKVKSTARIFFAGGWKPGYSTDGDLMLLAQSFNGKRVFKITSIQKVRRVSPMDVQNVSGEEKQRLLDEAEEISKMTWQELADLVGTEWVSGMNTPFDPTAIDLGKSLPDTTLYIGTQEEFFNFIENGEYNGTIVT